MGRVYTAIVAILAWAALILQFHLIASAQGMVVPGYEPGIGARIGNFFSYFTILSNILVALLTTSAIFAAESAWGQFFAKPVVVAAVEVNIAVTGLIYVTVLRPLWHPQGLQYVADAGLHYATPILFTIYWLVLVPKGRLQFADIAAFLAFPIVYGTYTLARGAFVGWYPYPFVSVSDLGYPKTLTNMVEMAVFFAVVGLVLVVVDRVLGRIRRDARAAADHSS